ncbi:MAG: ComEC/Rec2 family competence protein [Thermoguttaceae bacterium]|jgi:competence protein ComEC
MAAAGSQNAGAISSPAPYYPLVLVLAVAAGGIAADRWRPLPAPAWWGVAVAGLVAWLLLWRRGRLAMAMAALLLATAATAASWHHCRWRLFAEDDLGYFARPTREPVCLDAVALKTPRRMPTPVHSPFRTLDRGDQVRLEVEVIGIRDADGWRRASGRARMVVDALLPEVQACDRLRIFARLSEVPRPMNPGETDASANYRAIRVRSQLRSEHAECVTRLASGRPWSPRRLLEQTRMHGVGLLQQYLGDRNSTLAGAVLLGQRETLDPETTEAYVETGAIHLLVVAGLHLGILAGTMLAVMRRMPIPRRVALLVVALFTVLYAVLVDAQPPVIRAMILMLCLCGSLYFGRRRFGFNSLAAAGLVVLAINPCDLFRIGAQLSFLCVGGLMALAPVWFGTSREQDPIARLVAANRGWSAKVLWAAMRGLRHLTLVSLTIWLVTVPLVMARFHLVSPVAVLLNTFVWVPMVVSLLGGFGLLVLGAVAPPLAPLCAWICKAGLYAVDGLVHLGQRCPCGHFWVPGPPDWWLAGFYAGLALLLVFPRWRPPRRWCLAILAAWVAAGFGAAMLRTDRHHLRATFLHVGHGEAIVLELPSGKTLLYDAGEFGAPENATRAVAGFLWSRGIMHLDAVVLSHADSDHFNGLPGLLDRFSIGVIYVTPVMFEENKPLVQLLWDAIERAGVPVKLLAAPERLEPEAGYTIQVLHPPPKGVLGTDNANSLTLLLEYLDRRILLTGDLESPGLDDVLAEMPIHCDVLLVPHHGSRRSDPNRLAVWSTPAWAVVSGSHRWDIRPVASVYKTAGSHVLHTADTGAVTAVLGKGGVTVRTFVGDRERRN